jgi:hypothetical protein
MSGMDTGATRGCSSTDTYARIIFGNTQCFRSIKTKYSESVTIFKMYPNLHELLHLTLLEFYYKIRYDVNDI